MSVLSALMPSEQSGKFPEAATRATLLSDQSLKKGQTFILQDQSLVMPFKKKAGKTGLYYLH